MTHTNFLTNINVNQNELRNVVIQPLATAPSNPKVGQIYYNTTNYVLYSWDGSQWSAVGTSYVLPPATDSTLGGVIVSTGLSVDASGNLTIDTIPWNKLTSTPTTIAGYAITDAKIDNGVITLGNATITPVVDASYVHTDNNFTTTLKNKLDAIAAGAQVNTIESISLNGTNVAPDANKNVALTVNKATVGIGVNDLDVNDTKITNLADGVNDGDAVNKGQLDTAIAGIGTVFTLKGSVQDYSYLPTTGNVIGDVYYAEDSITISGTYYPGQVGYIWIEDSQEVERWEELGQTIDVNLFLQKGELAQTTGSSTTNAMSQDATTDAINGLIKVATGTISTSATSVTINTASGAVVLNTFATMSNAEVLVDVTIGASSVTFTCASAPSSAVTCAVIYK